MSARLLAQGMAIGAVIAAQPAAAQDRDLADSVVVDDPIAPPAERAARPRRVVISPYVEAGQVIAADLNSGDVLTYTELAAGVDASVATKRADAQLSLRYEHRFAWDDNLADADILSGLARGTYRLAPGLSIDGGALATRTRNDIRSAAPIGLSGNVANISKVYTVYGGPAYTRRVGPVALNAAYRIGYTKVETPSLALFNANRPRLDYYDDSVGQLATLDASVAPGVIAPVGLTASAAYDREDASQLKQRYEGFYVRGDGLYPISPHVALTAGVGYERIEQSQRDPLRDAAGAPVVDNAGRFVSDPASPRRVAYRTDGLYYDAGVVWRPNRRTSVEGHLGERYGSVTFYGSANWQWTRSVGLSVNVYDSVQTFGRQLRTGLANLPTSFVTQRDQLTGQFNGCVFGTSGAAPGGCLDDAFQSISTASYRARGIDAIIIARRGRATYGAGLGYSNRRLHAPDGGSGIVAYGLDDDSYYGQLFYAYSLSLKSGFDLTGFVNDYSSQLAGSGDVFSVGATASYYRYFGRISTTASVGLYHFDVDNIGGTTSVQGLLAARYRF